MHNTFIQYEISNMRLYQRGIQVKKSCCVVNLRMAEFCLKFMLFYEENLKYIGMYYFELSYSGFSCT